MNKERQEITGYTVRATPQSRAETLDAITQFRNNPNRYEDPAVLDELIKGIVARHLVKTGHPEEAIEEEPVPAVPPDHRVDELIAIAMASMTAACASSHELPSAATLRLYAAVKLAENKVTTEREAQNIGRGYTAPKVEEALPFLRYITRALEINRTESMKRAKQGFTSAAECFWQVETYRDIGHFPKKGNIDVLYWASDTGWIYTWAVDQYTRHIPKKMTDKKEQVIAGTDAEKMAVHHADQVDVIPVDDAKINITVQSSLRQVGIGFICRVIEASLRRAGYLNVTINPFAAQHHPGSRLPTLEEYAWGVSGPFPPEELKPVLAQIAVTINETR